MSANLEDPAVTKDWTTSILIPIPKKGITKECSNHWTIALISHDTKVMLKIFHARFQHYVNQELPNEQVGFTKAEEPEIKLSTSVVSQKKQGNAKKTSTSVSSTMLKPLTAWIITNCGNSYSKLLKRWEYQTILPVS